MLNSRAQGGFTLIELMISVVISMIVVLGAINLYLAIVDSGKDTYQRNRLTQEMRTLSSLVVRDVRRAGYWEAEMGVDDIWDNPFTTGSNDLSLGAMTGEAANSCILYSYDLDLDGVVDSPDEQFGFRLNNEGVQMYSDGGHSCDGGNWSTLTTPELSVTNLAFTLNETCLDADTEAVKACPCNTGDACQHIRRIGLSLKGAVAAEPSVTESLGETIRLRNDKFVLSVP